MEMKKNQQLEYPWNFIDAVLKEPLKSNVDRAEVERGLEYLLQTVVLEETRIMIERKYRDGITEYSIAKEFGLPPSYVSKTLRKTLKLLHRARYSIFLKKGYTAGKKDEEKRLAWSRKCEEIDERMRRVPGTFPINIHEIEDPYKRIDAIIERGGALSVWLLRQGTRVSNLLIRNHMHSVWHLCFHTEEQLLAIADCGEETLAKIVDVLYEWDLALDDGLLGSSEESLEYAAYAANLCDALNEQSADGGA
jgi:hypothetical protein